MVCGIRLLSNHDRSWFNLHFRNILKSDKVAIRLQSNTNQHIRICQRSRLKLRSFRWPSRRSCSTVGSIPRRLSSQLLELLHDLALHHRPYRQAPVLGNVPFHLRSCKFTKFRQHRHFGHECSKLPGPTRHHSRASQGFRWVRRCYFDSILFSSLRP